MCFPSNQGAPASRRRVDRIKNSPARRQRSQGLRSQVLVLLLCLVTSIHAYSSEQRILRIAADPNNLPFSNQRLEGFENKLADIIAQELGAKIEYIWRAQRRGFFRETLKNGDCDLVLGVPTAF